MDTEFYTKMPTRKQLRELKKMFAPVREAVQKAVDAQKDIKVTYEMAKAQVDRAHGIKNPLTSGQKDVE